MRPDPRQHDGAGQPDRKDASFAPFLEAITTAKARPTVASWSEIDNALTVAMTDMIVNGADVQQTLDQLAVTIDGLLAE